MSSPISILVTGGTIDKDYQATTGELIFPQTHIHELLQQANCTLDYELKVLMLKDSLEMHNQDRELIWSELEQLVTNKIVITHGTDTMVETGIFLQQKLHSNQAADKTIVLTGAMRPFKLGRSDASFNMGCAIMAAKISKPGIFIAMNGQLFEIDKVKKNKTIGVFESI